MINTVSQPFIEAIATSAGLNTSDVHEAFADERRQATLGVLVDKSTPVDVSTIARVVAAEESDSAIEHPPPDRIERVHVALYHVHLPKLAKLGLVEYDADAGIVTGYDDGLEAIST